MAKAYTIRHYGLDYATISVLNDDDTTSEYEIPIALAEALESLA